MEKNALVITNRVRKIPGGIVECAIKPLQELGYNVFWAADFTTAKEDLSNIPCKLVNTTSRTNPLNPKNIKTYKTIKKTIKDNNISFVFCHTPIGGYLGRRASHKLYVPHVVYEAHGFLFFKNGPKLGWLFKVFEKHLARYTDRIITINQEDYETAQRFKLRNNGKVSLVHGSGMKLCFDNVSKTEKDNLKTQFGISGKTKVIISIGELNSNKNVETLIKSLSFLNNQNFKVLICGEGPHDKNLRKLIKKNRLTDKVSLLGYRTDIPQLLKMSDIYVTCSKREGLSRTISESMALGLPCIVSNRRGMKDLIDDGLGGYLIEPKDFKDLAFKLDRLMSANNDELEKVSLYNKEKIKSYTTDIVSKECLEILSEVDGASK